MALLDGRCMPEAASHAATPSTHKWIASGDSNALWRLPDDANLEHLEAMIKAAFRGGEPLAIEVLDADDPAIRSSLIMNGRALPHVVLFERRRDR
jgi:hypothetical protein